MSKKISKAQIKRNRAAWVEALRSGKFKQTRGTLKSRNGSYCCLGVVCELAEVPRKWNGGDYTYGPEAYNGDWNARSNTSLPSLAMAWLGVDEQVPHLASPVMVKNDLGVEVEETNLIELNDTHKWSFEQIADAVEKNGLRDG